MNEDETLETGAEGTETTETQETQTETTETTETQAVQFDLRTKEQEEREQRIYAQAQADLLAKQQAEQALVQRQQTGQDTRRAKLEKIAELAFSDPVAAEEMRLEMATEEAETRVQARYGRSIVSAGVSAAMDDVDAKFPDAPAEVRPFLKAAVSELGLQDEIPTQFVKAVEEMGYGKAFKAGAVGKAPIKKTIAATGAESTTFTNASIPSDLQADAAEYDKYFGAGSAANALKEQGIHA